MGGSVEGTGDFTGSIERDIGWQVKMRKARSREDMRPRREINSLEKEGGARDIGAVETKGDWEKITITVDSGAVDSVAPERVAQGIAIKATEASR